MNETKYSIATPLTIEVVKQNIKQFNNTEGSIESTIASAITEAFPENFIKFCGITIIMLFLVLFSCAIAAWINDYGYYVGFYFLAAAFAVVCLGPALLYIIIRMMTENSFQKQPCPPSLSENLNRQLANYDPMDRDAYQDLQMSVRKQGWWITEVRAWLDKEQVCIERAAADAKRTAECAAFDARFPERSFIDRVI